MRASLVWIPYAMPFALATGQTPIAFQPLSAPSALAPQVRAAIEQKAASYQFEGVTLFAKDSALLVFVDSSLTAARLSAHTWMFGPPVTEAEADSCPPEKVLARKIARTFWRSLGGDVRIVHASAPFERLIGYRVKRVGAVATLAALAAVASVVERENDMDLLWRGPEFLASPAVLHALTRPLRSQVP